MFTLPQVIFLSRSPCSLSLFLSGEPVTAHISQKQDIHQRRPVISTKGGGCSKDEWARRSWEGWNRRGQEEENRKKISHPETRRSKGLNKPFRPNIGPGLVISSSPPQGSVQCRVTCKWDDVTSHRGLSIWSGRIFKVTYMSGSLHPDGENHRSSPLSFGL